MKLIFFTILLQSDVLGTLGSKLVDNALSLGILGVLAWVFWRELKDVRKSLDNYQNVDRKEMRESLDRNTSVMERLEEYLKRH